MKTIVTSVSYHIELCFSGAMYLFLFKWSIIVNNQLVVWFSLVAYRKCKGFIFKAKFITIDVTQTLARCKLNNCLWFIIHRLKDKEEIKMCLFLIYLKSYFIDSQGNKIGKIFTFCNLFLCTSYF